jgi:glycosyltransferase involved in cell wall biosynthesis
MQDYSAPIEVLLVDGGSVDNSKKIAKESGLSAYFINGGYPDNQEARRSVGIENATYEICVFIDSDNYMIGKKWLQEMVEPLLNDKEVIATQTLRYAAPKNESLLNRYFGLLGGADPVAYYLGKNDRLSWMFDRWNLLGTVLEEKKNYFKIAFDPTNYPSVGCNGVMFRKSILLKSNWGSHENYFHADVFVDIGKQGYNKFGIVKNEIFHITAGTPISFLKKRRLYMQLHHQSLHTKRRQLVFDPHKRSDVLKLVLFIFFAITFVEPIIESLVGYAKKRDSAWFLHPLMTVGMALLYSEATINRLFLKKS